MSTWRQVAAIVWKDLRVEWRTRETLVPMLIFCLLVVTIFGFALNPTGEPEPVFPAILWITFYFSGLLGLGRSFAAEKAAATLPGLMLAPGDRTYIFLGKAVASLVFLSVVEAISLPLFFALLAVPFTAPPLAFALVVGLGTVGFVSVTTLMSVMATHTRAAEMLLPILVFPLLVPGVIASVEATRSLLGMADPAGWVRWARLLAVYDALFVTLPLLLFDYLLEV